MTPPTVEITEFGAVLVTFTAPDGFGTLTHRLSVEEAQALADALAQTVRMHRAPSISRAALDHNGRMLAQNPQYPPGTTPGDPEGE